MNSNKNEKIYTLPLPPLRFELGIFKRPSCD